LLAALRAGLVVDHYYLVENDPQCAPLRRHIRRDSSSVTPSNSRVRPWMTRSIGSLVTSRRSPRGCYVG
jgi:hypothetical protein